MSSNKSVLVVRVDSIDNIDYITMRDEILESIRLGVLILGPDDTLEVMELPPLGGLEIERISEPTPESPETEPTAKPEPEPLSEGEEKRQILQRLKDYRAAHGLGSLEKVSAKTAHNKNQRISSNDLRSILTDGISMHIEEWRKISRALDKLEQEDAANGGMA